MKLSRYFKNITLSNVNEDKIINGDKIINKKVCTKTANQFFCDVVSKSINKTNLQLDMKSYPSWFYVKTSDEAFYERNKLSSPDKKDKYGIYLISTTNDSFVIDVCANKFRRDILDEKQTKGWYTGEYKQGLPLSCLGIYIEAYKQLEKKIDWQDKESVNDVFNQLDPDLFVQPSNDGPILNKNAITALKCACVKYVDNSECCKSYKKNFDLIEERPEKEELKEWKGALFSEVYGIEEKTEEKVGHSRYSSKICESM